MPKKQYLMKKKHAKEKLDDYEGYLIDVSRHEQTFVVDKDKKQDENPRKLETKLRTNFIKKRRIGR